MRIHNALPHLRSFLSRHEARPSPETVRQEYLGPITPLLAPMLEDFSSYGRDALEHAVADLDWGPYRERALRISSEGEEARLRRAIAGVEDLLGVPLEGEAVLFGSLEYMDGYARFDRGSHRVFLGVDESHEKGRYLDILFAHELTHVARESRESVWTGWGLDPKQSHDGFVATQTVIEHIVNEGLACTVSERLVPTDAPWDYCYQSEESLARVTRAAAALDREIHAEIANPDGHYHALYDTRRYGEGTPRYAHYAWAWAFVKDLLRRRAQEPRDLVALCSKELAEEALRYELARGWPR